MVQMGYLTKNRLLFVLPTLVILILIIAFPLMYNIYLSVLRWQIRFRGALPTFIGAGNFLSALSDFRFYNSLSKTFYLLIFAVPIELSFALGLALLLQEEFRGRRLVSSFILLPLALSDAVIGLVWGLVLVPTYGPFDLMMRTLGLWEKLGFAKPISPMIEYPMQTIVVADVWQWTPFFFLILLAALAALPVEPFEAAKVDGASSLQTIRHLTIPMLKQTIGVALIIRMMDIFKCFGVPYVLTKGGPGFASEVTSLYIFNQALQFLNLTYAATLTLVVIVLVTVLLTAFVRIYRFRF
jgi:multiple sugar transport system permease protein